jgi:hypothetical protein
MVRPKTEQGQTYGKRQEQVESQQAVPMHKEPSVSPGQAGPFSRRTERPREPITTGLAGGPGAGPESLAMPSTPTDGRELEYSEALVRFLPTLEVRAAEPDASGTFRLFVRRVRQMAAQAPMLNETL